MPKLRYHELDQVLRRRPSLGRLLSSRPGTTCGSKAVVTTKALIDVRARHDGLKPYEIALLASPSR